MTLSFRLSPPADRAASASSARADGYFAHHGFWAPGVRLFRNIGFTAKALIISAILLVPILYLGWSYVSTTSANIEFSAKERLGVEYAKPTLALLRAAQQLRMQATLGAAAGSEPAALATARAAVDQALAALQAIDARLGGELQTTRQFEDVRRLHAAMASVAGDAEGVFAQHTGFVNAILALLGQATDQSNLTLDPDIDSYYLMDASLFRIPPILEALGVLRGTGGAVLATGKATPGQIELMRDTPPLFQHHLSSMKTGLAKSFAAAPQLAEAVDPDAAFEAAEGFVAEARQLLLAGGTPSGDRTAFSASATRAMDAQYELVARILDALDGLLVARIDRMTTSRTIALAITAVAIALAAYFFYAFYLVMHGGLREVRGHLEAITAGDLTGTLRPWGRDEAAQLMTALAATQSSLRGIVAEVRAASDQIVATSIAIQADAGDLSGRTERSAASLQNTASSMEEIASTVRQTADSASQAAEVASDNAQVADRGGQAIRAVVSTMGDINASSTRISEIIATIDGIAFQTNILALNAAVEAARAGEQGRGFAVVAGEVRSLAQRSASAAREIKGLITASVQKVSQGTATVDGAGRTMMELVDNARRISQLVGEISVAAREQTTGVAQVGSAVTDLDRSTQDNAALVERTAASAEHLREQADQLAARVARFRLT